MRKLVPALFVFVFAAIATTAPAAIRVFENNICPICVGLSLKSDVTFHRNDQCVEKACKGERFDENGKWQHGEDCFDCTAKYFYKCTQGHSFETLTKPEKK